MADNRPIGIFDSGLGGLTVAKEIIKALPNENIIYFGDTSRVPYGTRSQTTIREYALEDESFLIDKGVKLVVAACGTVSSVASDIGKCLPIPYFEVVSSAVKNAVLSTNNKRIGVIATNATIKSGEHKRQILELLPDAKVFTKACNLFVPLVEQGWYSADDNIVYNTVERYLEDIKKAGVDTLILGCTHYPILSDAISRYLGDNVTLINAGTTTAVGVARYLEDNLIKNDSSNSGDYMFYLSDKTEAFYSVASLLLGDDIQIYNVEQVDIRKK